MFVGYLRAQLTGLFIFSCFYTACDCRSLSCSCRIQARVWLKIHEKKEKESEEYALHLKSSQINI